MKKAKYFELVLSAFLIQFIFIHSVSYAQGEADNSSSLTRLGVMKIRHGDYEGAIKLLDKAIDMNKENILAYYQRGMAKSGLANYKDAIVDFDKAIQLESTYAPAYIERSRVKKLNGDGVGSQKDFQKACELDQSYLTYKREEVKEIPSVAGAQKAEAKKEESKNELDMLAISRSKERTAEQSLYDGIAKELSGDFESAIESYKFATSQDATLKKVWESHVEELKKNLNKGEMQRKKVESQSVDDIILSADNKVMSADYEGAIADYDKAVVLNPKNANLYLNRGEANQLAGNLEDAVKDYNKAVSINPKLFIAYQKLGDIKYLDGDLDGTLEYYKKIEKINKPLGEYLKQDIGYNFYNRGRSNFDDRNFKEAMQNYDKAISTGFKNALAYTDRGNVKVFLGDYKGAIEDFNKAFSIEPNYVFAYAIYYGRGTAKGNLGDYKGAFNDCDKAIQMNPNYAEAYGSRGKAKYCLGDYKGAIKDWEKAIELNPSLEGELQTYIDSARADMK